MSRKCKNCDEGKSKCIRCGGDGKMNSGEKCPICQGEGVVECPACEGKGEIDDDKK